MQELLKISPNDRPQATSRVGVGVDAYADECRRAGSRRHWLSAMRKSQASTRMLEVREAGRLDPKEWSDRAIARHVGAHVSTVSNIRQARATRALLRERGLDADAIDDTKLYRIATLGAGMDDLARGSVRGIWLSVGTGQDMDTSWST